MHGWGVCSGAFKGWAAPCDDFTKSPPRIKQNSALDDLALKIYSFDVAGSTVLLFIRILRKVNL